MSKRPNLVTMDPMRIAQEKMDRRAASAAAGVAVPSDMTNPTNPSNPPKTSEPANTPNPTETANPGDSTKTSKPTKTGHAAKRAHPGEIAPSRDFTRVANSIIRDAVSAGVFVGKSKQLYDVLYQRTRGAIVPKMSAQVPREVLMTAADISSTITLKKNLFHLRQSGLITWVERPGVRGGNEYTVYLPEEANPSNPTNPGNTPQKLEGLDSIGTDRANPGSDLSVSTVYGSPNTSSKTLNTIDDEAYTKFRALVARVTGIPTNELTFNRTLEFLGETFERIAKRTTAISDPDALLETHLRREGRRQPREAKRDVQPGAETPDREFNLESSIREMRDYLTGGFDIEQFRQGYTDEQWAAITEGVKHDVSQADSQSDGEL